MLGAFAIPSYTAHAADEEGTAGICDPTQTIRMGDDISANTKDDSVATYVGRDMYIGANTGSTNTYDKNTAISPSYAVEAEGLTLVNGKLAIHSVKQSWKSSGFRFGVVGFGSQFRPDGGSDALVVAGQNSQLTLKDNNGTSVSALGGWTNSATARGFLNKQDSATYYGKINGSESRAIGTDSWSDTNGYRSVYSGTSKDDVKYSSSYTDFSSVSINGNTKNFNSFFNDNILGLSNQLKGLANTGTVTESVADTNLYARYKYNDTSIAYGFNNGSGITLNEKKLTFVGTNNPTMEVFNIDASLLKNGTYDGISFAFENINEKASVVINVTGGDVEFNNGWRFWWNGNEISNGYVESDVTSNGSSWPYTTVNQATRDAYSTAAQKIMWNFADANKVTIKGGANGKGNDDPAAAMLGSIMVPNGSFEDHVTTNGRVYVGVDFSMYNPTVAGSFDEGNSASIIDMDQERHNFPWSGTLTASCSAIEWNKVDEDGNALAGTVWGVYASYADAEAGTNALLEVTDNGKNDWNSLAGTIQVQPLNPNATYYLKEIETVSGYELNKNVYSIKTESDASVLNTTVKYSIGEGVFMSAEDASSDPSKLIQNDGSIVNTKEGGPLSWTKADAEDGANLAGSEWDLSSTDENYENPTSTSKITDLDDSASVLTALDLVGVPSTLESDGSQSILAVTPTPSTASSAHTFQYSTDGTTWQDSAPGNTVTILTGDKLVGTNYSSADTTVYIRACSTTQQGICSEGKKTTVKPGTSVSQLTVYSGTTEIGNESTYTLAAGNSMALSATAMNGDTQVDGSKITWSVEGEGFSLSSANGSSVTLTTPSAGGTGVVIVKAGSREVVFEVHAKNTTTVYVPKSLQNWSSYYIHYGLSTDTTWAEKQMTLSSGECSDYYTVEIPMSSATKSHYFKLTSSSGWSGDIWPSNLTTANVPFNGTIVNTVSSSTNSGNPPTTSVPDGCTATTSAAAVALYAESDEAGIAVASDDAGDTGTYKDSDPRAGAFTVDKLPDGYYTLTESTIPDGYDQTKPVKVRVQMKGGKVVYWAVWDYTTGTWVEKTGTDLTLDNERTPAAATWQKIDSSDNGLLAGAEWKVTQTKKWDAATGTYKDLDAADQKSWTVTDISDASTVCTASDTVKCDVDTAAGKIKIDGLDWGEYTVQETKAPEGYELSDQIITFDVSKNALTADTGVQVKDTRKSGDVEWGKVDSTDATKLLAGSEWKVTQTQKWDSATGKYVDIAEADQKSWTVKDWTTAAATQTSDPNCTAGDTVKCDVDGAQGKIKVDGLDWGTYTLVETKAPDGYNIGTSTYQFQINASNLTGAKITIVGDEGTDPTDNQIPNTPGFTLPKTGGIGTQMYTAVGFAVTVMALAGIGLSTRKTRARSRR